MQWIKACLVSIAFRMAKLFTFFTDQLNMNVLEWHVVVYAPIVRARYAVASRAD